MRSGEAKAIRSLHAGAIKALEKAVRKAIAEHESAGVPAAIWQDGKVVLLSGRRAKRIRSQTGTIHNAGGFGLIMQHRVYIGTYD